MAAPVVSVVIPMRNEGTQFAQCLESVLAQDYPAEQLEIIVIDGESDDESALLVRTYAAQHARLRVLQNPRRIVPTAMNIGIRAARGAIVARVDGHTRIAPDYVRIGVDVLRRTRADNVGGPMHPVGGGVFGDAVSAAMTSRFGIGAYFHFGTEERDVDTVYLGMWPRDVFERVGLFDEELERNQDDEFNYRLRKLGGRIVFTPRMRSWYQNRQSITRLARQFYQYGEWKVRVLQKHPRQMSWRHCVPPAFVAALLLTTAAAPFTWLGGAGALTIAALYVVGVSVIAARNGAGAGWRQWMATVAAFMIIHVAWGSGVLSGLLRYADRWRRAEPPPPKLQPTSVVPVEQ
jgi:glycosyltransferase involved in cell wall biosynthesis